VSKLRKYRVIEQKLEQMPGPDVDGLWMDMRSRLDHHMPEATERRRMLWWWKNSGIFLVVPLVIFVSAIFFTIVVLDNNDQTQDAVAQTGITSQGVTISDDVPDITADDITAAPSGSSVKLPSASRKALPAPASIRKNRLPQAATQKSETAFERSQPAATKSPAPEANDRATDVTMTAYTPTFDIYDVSINPAGLMRQGLNTDRSAMPRILVLLPVPKQRTTGFVFVNPVIPAPAGSMQVIDAPHNAFMNPGSIMRQALNADPSAIRRYFVQLPVPQPGNSGLFLEQPQQASGQVTEPASDASLNPGGIMRQALNAGPSTLHAHLVLLPAPKAKTTGFLFLDPVMPAPVNVSTAVPELPLKTKAAVKKKAGYPLLTLSTNLTRPAVVLQQRDLVPAVTDTMTFPSNALFEKRLAFAKKIVVGAAVHMNLPVSSQEMSMVSVNGGHNKLFDYMPSVYGQYHFAPRFFVQSEFQSVTPQYTPRLTLSSTTVDLAPNKKQVQSVVLTKFYYMNLPVSLHYKVLPNLYAGAGIQYSYLTRSMLMEENSTWQNGTNGWEQKTSNAKLHVKKNPKKEKARFKAPTDPTSTDPIPVPTPVDMVAQRFKSNDWRFTYDLNYYRRRLNAGFRMNIGINNYIDTEVSGTNVPVKDRNKSFQLYIRYNIWEQKRY
jgi:hypothetical protein